MIKDYKKEYRNEGRKKGHELDTIKTSRKLIRT